MLNKTKLVSAVRGAQILVREMNAKNRAASEILFCLRARAAGHSFMDADGRPEAPGQRRKAVTRR